MTIQLETVVTWKWSKPGYRSQFTSEHVNVLRAMVSRNYPRALRFVCVTDDPIGLDPGIEYQPIGSLWSDIPNPSWRNGPSCYRRLAMFSPDAAHRFGRRFVSIDLDAVVVGDLSPVWDRPEEIVLWSDPLFKPKGMYCGSMVLVTAGAFPQIYTQFDPDTSPAKSRAAGCLGSDQGWMSYCLGPGRPAWSTDDGVYSFWVHLEKTTKLLPKDARIVFFHGARDPWHADVQDEFPWVAKNWRL